MAIELETAELQINTVGAEAAQQALDALGVDAEQVNAAAGDGPAGPGAEDAGPGSVLTDVLAALNQQTEILQRIAAAVENQPPSPPATY